MRVTFRDGLFRGTHITGPTHNYLGMRVEPAGAGRDFQVVVLPLVGSCRHHPGLIPSEVGQWIALGIEQANHQLGTTFGVEYAEVVENDSRRPEVYTELAKRIVIAASEPAR